MLEIFFVITYAFLAPLQKVYIQALKFWENKIHLKLQTNLNGARNL
jgi:hypothetical protein